MELKEINQQVVKVVLSDNKEYEIPVPNIGTFILIEDLLDCSIEDVYKKFNEKKLKGASFLLFAMLKQNNPLITLEEVNNLLTIDNLLTVATVMFEQISKASPKISKKEESQPEIVENQ